MSQCVSGFAVIVFLACAVPLAAHGHAGSVPADSSVQLRNGGWLLAGTFTAPAGRRDRLPAVLLLNRAAGDRHAYDSVSVHLADQGVASLRLDLRGHGESVNRGRFVPGAAGMDSLLDGTETDIVEGLRFLTGHPRIDAGRLGLVGASYSGELALSAARGGAGVVSTYALLSPGSLSMESVTWLEGRARRWLFVASRQERSRATRDVIAMVQDSTRWADIMLFAPEGHATRMLDAVPEFARQLAAWLAAQLTPPAPRPPEG